MRAQLHLSTLDNSIMQCQNICCSILPFLLSNQSLHAILNFFLAEVDTAEANIAVVNIARLTIADNRYCNNNYIAVIYIVVVDIAVIGIVIVNKAEIDITR